jgi:zinc protease
MSITCNGQKSDHFYDKNRIPIDPGIKIGKLHNGFTYYIVKPDSTDGIIRMRLLVKVGTNFEDEDQLEFAHLVEHMAFEGTLHFPGDSLRRYTSRQGIVGGLGIGAMTGPMRTTYQIDIPENDAELFNNGLLILRDWTQDAIFNPDRIQAQVGAVIGEHRMNGDRVSAKVSAEKNHKVLDNNYGNEFFESARKNLRIMKSDSLLQFYKEWYRPDLEAVVIVGNVDVEDLEKRIGLVFSDLKTPAHRRKTDFFFNRQDGKLANKRRLIKIADGEMSGADLEFYYKRLSHRSNLETIEDYRGFIVDNICSNLLSQWGRSLGKRIFARSLRSGIYRHFNNSSIDVLTIQVGLNGEEEIENSYKVISSELDILRKRGFDSAFFKAAKESFLNMLTTYLKNQATVVEKCADHFVSGNALCSSDYELELAGQLISGITLNDINKEISGWLKITDNKDIVIAGRDEYRFPNEEDLDQWEIENRHVPLAKQKSSKIMLTSNDFVKATKFPKVSNQIAYKEKYFLDTSIVLLEFENGAKVFLAPGSESLGDKKNEIVLTAFKPLIIENDSINSFYRNVSLDIFNSMGLGILNKDELDQFQHDMRIYVNRFIDESSSRIVGSCRVDNLESMLQNIYLYFTPPRMDKEEFVRWKSNKRYEIKRIYDDSEVYFENKVKSVTRSERLFTIDDVDNIELDKALRFYSNQFSGVGDFTFFVTGDYTISEDFKKMILQYIGSLKMGRVGGKLEPLKFNAAGKVSETYYLGNKEKSEVCLLFACKEDVLYSIRNRAILILLKEILRARIFARLRTREGGTYYPITYLEDRRISKVMFGYRLGIKFDCDPGNVDNMIGYVLEEFENLRDGVLDENSYTTAMSEAISYISQWNKITSVNGTLEEMYLYDSFIKNSDTIDKVLPTITLEELQDGIRLYMANVCLQKFVLLPRKL